MQVRILYFASLREMLGTSSESVRLPEGVDTAGALREWLIRRGAPYTEALGAGKAIRMSVDQTMANASTPLSDDVEFAFFPPVTGG